MTTGRLIWIAASAVAVAAFAAAWVLLAPTQAGGGTSYAMVVGTSMEPVLSRGDLAIVRKRSSYRVGDVVLYDSRDLGAKVLHRIVRVEGDRFVLQGDNNDFLDPEKPTEEQIVGALWATAPGVGGVTQWLRKPMNAALLVTFAALVALGGGLGAGSAVRRGTRTSPKRTSRRLPSWRSLPDEQKTLALGLGAVAAALVVLATAAFSRPVAGTETLEGAYSHQGRFAYEARVSRNSVYPDGRVTTGEPVFLRLVDRLRVSFDYALESAQPAEAGGRVALVARISDGRGWQRVLPLASERAFDSRSARVSGVLDLRRIERIVDEVRALTGSGQTAFTVALLPRVDVRGRVGGEPVQGTFAPALAFDLADLRLQPNLDAEGVGPFAPRESRPGTRPAAARLSLGPFSLAVATARRVSLLGIAALLLLAGSALVAQRRREDVGPAERIRARYGHLIVPVSSRSGGWDQVTELPDMQALVRLADHHGRLILHVADAGGHSYVVEDGANAFRYRAGRDSLALPPVRDLRVRSDEAR